MRVQGDSGLPQESPAQSGEAAGALSLTVHREGGDWSTFADLEGNLSRAAAALARHVAGRLPARASASVALGSDALVRELNRTYRQCDAATNVLAFPYQRPASRGPANAGAEEGGYLGDIILAEETVVGEARELGIAPEAHLQHLLVHGLLHLLGSDHRNDAEAEAMERLETAILASIGVADPHAAPA